jgi:hypothetical protein
VFTSLLAGECLTTNSGLLRKDFQQWGLLRFPRLHQGRPCELTSDGSVFQLLTADSESEPELRVPLRPAVYRQSVRIRDNPLETNDLHFFQLNTCGHNPYVTSSLTRRWVCVYHCRWSSPVQSFPRPSPAGLITAFYFLRFETLLTWRARLPYLYPPGTGWPSYTLRYWVIFSSPPTTSRSTVDLFDPASTRDSSCRLKTL